jgi:large subunit ribosomal protein L23
MRTLLLRPLINEKSMNLTKNWFYTFEVDKTATKDQISKIVKAKFKVDPISVKIVNIAGKKKMQRKVRKYYVTSGIKKALVQLKEGQKIALFEVAPQEETKEVAVRTAEGELVAKTKEKKSLLKGTKVKVEQMSNEMEAKKEDEEKIGQRGQKDLKTSHKEAKKKGAK